MPRENLHFSVAKRLTDSFPELHHHLELLLIGSVIHDSPYYLTGSQFEGVALRLHGNDGEDTLACVHEMVQRTKDTSLHTEVFAIAAGMVSHIAVDQVFHPAIYYLTGDYFAADLQERVCSQARHRAFETELDLGVALLQKTPRFGTLFRRQSARIQQLAPFLPESEQFPGTWFSAISRHATIDTLSRSRAVGALLTPFSFLPKIEEGLALSVFRKSPRLLDTTLRYRNPVTGESFERVLREMLEEALLRSIQYVQDLSNPRPRAPGASLNFDVVGASFREARYFSEQR